MKMRKMIYIYLIILTVILGGIIYISALRYELETSMTSQGNIYLADGREMTELKDNLEILEVVSTDVKEPLDRMYKVGEEKANLFSLSFDTDELKVGDVLTQRKSASDALYLIFRESYPNVSLEEMGLDTPEEAYMAMQLAIWEISARTGEANQYTELSKVDSVKETVGLKNVNPKIFKRAKDMVTFVEDYNHLASEEIRLVPTLIIHNDEISERTISVDDDMLMGPYYFELEAGIFTNAQIILMDQNNQLIDGTITNINGKEIKNLSPNQEFYIRVSNEREYVKFIVKVDYKRLSPTIYEKDNKDYIANTYTNETLESDLEIEIEKI